MNLPHKAPLIFAKEVLEKDEHIVKVSCVFPEVPTLAMFIEAAAQGSAGFSSKKSQSIGFITLVQNINKLYGVTGTEYIITIEKESEVARYKKFFFIVRTKESNKAIATGNFTLMLEKLA